MLILNEALNYYYVLHIRTFAAHAYPCLEELLQDLKLLLGPGTCVFWSDFELQCLVVLWVESHAALEYLRLEHDHPRLIRVHNR